MTSETFEVTVMFFSGASATLGVLLFERRELFEESAVPLVATKGRDYLYPWEMLSPMV